MRMVKLQQKTRGASGGRRGLERFCRIRSYVSTMSKQGKFLPESRGVRGAREVLNAPDS